MATLGLHLSAQETHEDALKEMGPLPAANVLLKSCVGNAPCLLFCCSYKGFLSRAVEAKSVSGGPPPGPLHLALRGEGKELDLGKLPPNLPKPFWQAVVDALETHVVGRTSSVF